MRHWPNLLLLILVIGLLLPSGVSALGSGMPDHDAYIDVNEPDQTHDDDTLSMVASQSTCNDTRIVYLQWGLADVAGTVDGVTLTLTATVVSNVGSASVGLYETGDGWAEATLTANNAPAVGALLEEQPTPITAGETLVFDGAALKTYVTDQAAGDDVASFALRFSADCENGLNLVEVASEEGGDGPYLLILDPNAVRVRALDGGGGWAPALLGLVGVALGVGRYRRRRR